MDGTRRRQRHARGALRRLVALRPGEAAAALWAFAWFFCLLAGYYVLRPLRDEMGIAGGVANLPWLFTATFVTMLCAVPMYGRVVAVLPRRRFVPLVYHFLVANLAVFWLLLQLDAGSAVVVRVFFVWVSVFNLFAVSVFWSFVTDLFTSEQGKRLFGLVAAGGSAGALLGPLLTVALAVPLGPVNLLVAAMVLLELAVLCAMRLERSVAAPVARGGAVPAPSAGGMESRVGDTMTATPRRFRSGSAKPLGGSALAGYVLLLRSPYLAGIGLWVALLSLAGTFLYFAQADIVAASSSDPAVRTRIFASIDLAVGVLTLAIQLGATGALLGRLGAGRAAALLPLVFCAGFVVLAAFPVLGVVIGFQALQRTANFALSNPARQVLFTVVDAAGNYKARNVIDTVVFRGADALAGWLFAALRAGGLGISAIAWVSVPVAAVWLLLALALGRAQEARARA
jgi:AAA family ATP:ADP antiporter